MFSAPGRRGVLLSATTRRRLGLAALLLLLVLTWQAARTLEDPTRLVLAALSTAVVAVAWAGQLVRPNVASIWALGIGAIVLVTVLPSAAAVFGIVAAIVTAATLLDGRASLVTACVLGGGFLLAEAVANAGPSPLNLALNGVGLAFAYLGSRAFRRLREERERAESLLAELQRTRQGQLEAAALAERTRIAREIHDVLAHTLSALAVQLQGAQMLLEQQPDDHAAAVSAVERAHRLAREGLAETRRAVGALRGDRLPGADQLARLADDFNASGGAPACTFDVEGTPRALGVEADLAVYRTAQEALTNIHKHAVQPSLVAMHLRYAPAGVELIVEDTESIDARRPSATRSTDGHVPADLDADALGAGRGYGLVGMRERAELLGGTLEAQRGATGFSVRLWLPSA